MNADEKTLWFGWIKILIGLILINSISQLISGGGDFSAKMTLFALTFVYTLPTSIVSATIITLIIFAKKSGWGKFATQCGIATIFLGIIPTIFFVPFGTFNFVGIIPAALFLGVFGYFISRMFTINPIVVVLATVAIITIGQTVSYRISNPCGALSDPERSACIEKRVGEGKTVCTDSGCTFDY